MEGKKKNILTHVGKNFWLENYSILHSVENMRVSVGWIIIVIGCTSYNSIKEEKLMNREKLFFGIIIREKKNIPWWFHQMRLNHFKDIAILVDIEFYY